MRRCRRIAWYEWFWTSVSSRVMLASEMVASSVSVTVPERTDALGASGSWMTGVGELLGEELL